MSSMLISQFLRLFNVGLQGLWLEKGKENDAVVLITLTVAVYLSQPVSDWFLWISRSEMEYPSVWVKEWPCALWSFGRGWQNSRWRVRSCTWLLIQLRACVTDRIEGYQRELV